MPSLAVITPTISRLTLKRALLSAQMKAGDEWLVIGDGRQQRAAGMVMYLWQTGRQWLRYMIGPETGDKGNSQRDFGIQWTNAEYLLFLDDDDVFLPGAIEAVRAQMTNGPVMFKMKHPSGVIWRDMRIEAGNVGGSMLCVPNHPDLPKWADSHKEHGSDIDFIERVYRMWSDLKWNDSVIIEVNPDDEHY